MLRYINYNIVGEGEHRSGWPYCIDALRPLFSEESPILFDDFTERSFLYDAHHRPPGPHPHLSCPWVGVFHHPHDIPTWYLPQMRLQNLFDKPEWRASVANLKLAIVLGANLYDWWRVTYPNIPVAMVKHPTGRPLLEWSPDRFLASTPRRVVQVGWFLRNTTAIKQAVMPEWLQKSHLKQNNYWSGRIEPICAAHYRKVEKRTDHGTVEIINQLSDTDYDLLLAESVVFVEVISAVANNAVVECIARNTPICVNRHPGPLSYLGDAYPLFYDRFDDIEKVLTCENIMAAHEYLCRLDKWWIRGGMFREQVHAACVEHVPECRNGVVHDEVSCIL